MFHIGSTEILIIAIIILFLFGSKKLPEFSRGLGEGIRELRKSFNEKDNKKED